MSQSENKNEITFRPDLQAAADKVVEAGKAVMDTKTGIIVIPATHYYANAPEGVTEDGDTKSAAHRDLMVNATTLGGGILAADAFAANPALDSVTISMPVRKNASIEVVWNRDGQSRNPSTGEVTKFKGALGVRRLEERSMRTNAEFSSIKSHIRSLMPQSD